MGEVAERVIGPCWLDATDKTCRKGTKGCVREHPIEEIRIGDTVTFISGSGYESVGYTGRVVAIDRGQLVVRYVEGGSEADRVRLLNVKDVVRGSLRFCQYGSESPLDHLCRIEKAIKGL